MKANIYPISSILQKNNGLIDQGKSFLEEISKINKISMNVVDLEQLYNNCDASFIFVQSGGSEAKFLEILEKLKDPIYILSWPENNSLAASMEILSYLKQQKHDAKILHGSVEYLSTEIKNICLINQKITSRYGVIGQPSDWLIASKVSYEDAKELHNMTLVDIPISEVIENFNHFNPKYFTKDLNLDFPKKDLDEAKRLCLALDEIIVKYNLDGLTIRCFDLLGPLKTTACLALSLLNSDNIVATCEGDIPAMVSMSIANKLFGNPGFQANPSRIDTKESTIIFAHCTLPLNMAKSFKLDTHFESNIGVGIRAKMYEQEITVFKLSNNLKDYFVASGHIINNLEEQNLCRTQIKVKLDNNINYFLNSPYGNHHIILYGNHVDEIKDYMSQIIK